MLIRKAALLGVFIFHAAPALADPFAQGRRPEPRPISSFQFAEQSVEVLAVTRRARADTPFLRDYVDECEDFSKVYPGYPQPAIVSFDLRLNF
ncbi:MAG: hypothetical protein AAFW81_10070 [Pseudomonadota bacterium]